MDAAAIDRLFQVTELVFRAVGAASGRKMCIEDLERIEASWDEIDKAIDFLVRLGYMERAGKI